MTILNDEFFAQREAAQKHALVLMTEGQAKIGEAEALADRFGFDLSASFGGRSHWYTPKRPDGVDTEDDRFGDTDWQESEEGYYGDITGWANSSTNC